MEAILFLIDLIAMFLLVRWSAKMDKRSVAVPAARDRAAGHADMRDADADSAITPGTRVLQGARQAASRDGVLSGAEKSLSKEASSTRT
jgi:hypothetical protein